MERKIVTLEIEDGSLIKCVAYDEIVSLPENEGIVTINGLSAFSECSEMKALILPEGVKSIGMLRSIGPLTVTIPDTVEEIEYLFCNEKNLDRIVCSKKMAEDICSGKKGSLSAMSGHRTLLSIRDNEDCIKVLLSESVGPMGNFRCNMSVNEDGLDFVAYDEILCANKKYKLAQNERILAMICRLTYPEGLTDHYRGEYETYICKNVKKTIPVIVDENDINMLKLLISIGASTDKNKEEIYAMLSDDEWKSLI